MYFFTPVKPWESLTSTEASVAAGIHRLLLRQEKACSLKKYFCADALSDKILHHSYEA